MFAPLDIVVTLTVIIAFVAICSWTVKGEPPKVQQLIWGSLVAHQLAALFMVVVTTSYYGGGDMTGYARTGIALARLMRDDFFGTAPDIFAGFLGQEVPLPVNNLQLGSSTGSTKAAAGFLMFFLGDSLTAVCALMAGLTCLAKIAVFRAVRSELPGEKATMLATGCLLLPSVVYWSSGLLKEPFAIIGLGLFMYGARLALGGRRMIVGLLMLALGLTLMLLIKGYLVPPLGVGVCAWLAARSFRSRQVSGAPRPFYWLAAAVVAAGAIFATGALLPRFAIDSLEDEIVETQAVGARTEGGSNYELGGGTVITQAPLALLTALFRPFLFEVSNPMMLLSATEMTWLTMLTVMALFRSGLYAGFRRVASQPALAFCAAFALTLGIGVGLATTNLGSLSRYRMPLMPFYFIVVATLARSVARREPQALGSVGAH